MRNCDRLTTYRQICAQVAREDGLIACFMTKPFMGVSASGCHHNMSLWTGGEDQVNTLHQDPVGGLDGVFSYRSGGENLFMPDPKIDERKPGPIGLQCIGGVMKHLDALSSAAPIRYGLTMESTDRYSKRPGADMRSPQVRFW